ncbi:hypothetical protein HDU89_000717, partial [Geranomyces variabilis]
LFAQLKADVLAAVDHRIASTALTGAHDDLATTGRPSLRHGLRSTGGEAPVGTTQRSTREVSINGDGSPASSVNSHKSAKRIQKFLMDAIPHYSGTGGVHKLRDFEAKMDAYIRQDEDMSPSTVLALATSRLTDIASLWWQKHETSIVLEDPRRIRTWKQLSMALRAQFCPIASVQNMCDQLHALVQKGSVASYSVEFLRISLQVRNLGPEEESHSYIRGLKPAVQDLVKTALLKSDGSDICDISVDVLQSTALSLGDERLT